MAIDLSIVQELCKEDGGKYAVRSTEEAYRFCTGLMRSHYENFPVGSVLVGKKLQPHFAAVYAFARLSDDIADELPASVEERLALLHNFATYLERPDSSHPVFRALAHTRAEKELPAQPFLRLLQAFRMDSEFQQAENWQDLHRYCSYSANPVGEIVLRLFGECDEQRLQYSDAICTALQLANFWQDLSVDIPRGRYYVPRTVLAHHAIGTADFATGEFSAKFPVQASALLHEVYAYTHTLFASGTQIMPLLESRRLRCEVALTIEGGKAILEKSTRLGRNIFSSRPSLGFADAGGILWKALFLYRRF